MTNQELVEKYFSKTLDYIAGLPRTQKEVVQRLNKYLYKISIPTETKQEIVRAVVGMCTEQGFINDFKYTQDFVSSVVNSSKPRSTLYIKRFLMKKGIAISLIEQSLSKIDISTEREAAKKLAVRKLVSFRNVARNLQKKKLWVYLAGKGFGAEVIGYVLAEVFGVE